LKFVVVSISTVKKVHVGRDLCIDTLYLVDYNYSVNFISQALET